MPNTVCDSFVPDGPTKADTRQGTVHTVTRNPIVYTGKCVNDGFNKKGPSGAENRFGSGRPTTYVDAHEDTLFAVMALHAKVFDVLQDVPIAFDDLNRQDFAKVHFLNVLPLALRFFARFGRDSGSGLFAKVF